MQARAQHPTVELCAFLDDDPIQIAQPDTGALRDRFVHDDGATLADGPIASSR